MTYIEFQGFISEYTTPLYTGNTQTYTHSLYINTNTYQQFNYFHFKHNYTSTIQLHAYTKRKREGHNQNKVFFSNLKEFHNEHGYISYFFSFFSVVISSINVAIFNLFQ